MKRYLAKTRKRVGGFECLRCKQRFSGRDTYDRHLVQYLDGDWCHLGVEVGLIAGDGGWYFLPDKPSPYAQGLQLDAVTGRTIPGV